MTDKRSGVPKDYMGDGVYAVEGPYLGALTLTTEDGVSVQNEIVLDDLTIAAVERFIKRMKEGT